MEWNGTNRDTRLTEIAFNVLGIVFSCFTMTTVTARYLFRTVSNQSDF